MAITEICTAAWLKERYLYGIDLTDDDGDAYPDSLFSAAIDSAVETLSTDLDIFLKGTKTFTDRLDCSVQDGESYFLMRLSKRPVLEATKLLIRFGSFPAAELPYSWVLVREKLSGQIQVVPGPESSFIIGYQSAFPLVGFGAFQPAPYTPGWFTISYKAGFEEAMTGTVAFSNGSAVLTGTSTKFTEELEEGEHIKLSDGSLKRVTAIDSDTSLTVESAYSGSSTGLTATAYKYPSDILDAIGLFASMLPLDTAGDLIAGAGIASKSISMDGLSTSINTTSSSTNSGYGARVIQYNNRLKFLMPIMRGKYRGMAVGVV